MRLSEKEPTSIEVYTLVDLAGILEEHRLRLLPNERIVEIVANDYGVKIGLVKEGE
jgi:hypothetical protein